MNNNNQHTSLNIERSDKGYQQVQLYYMPNSGHGNPFGNCNQPVNYNGFLGQGNKY
jgi:hypothetical protein